MYCTAVGTGRQFLVQSPHTVSHYTSQHVSRIQHRRDSTTRSLYRLQLYKQNVFISTIKIEMFSRRSREISYTQPSRRAGGAARTGGRQGGTAVSMIDRQAKQHNETINRIHDVEASSHVLSLWSSQQRSSSPYLTCNRSRHERAAGLLSD